MAGTSRPTEAIYNQSPWLLLRLLLVQEHAVGEPRLSRDGKQRSGDTWSTGSPPNRGAP
jgi:hypothetical protein